MSERIYALEDRLRHQTQEVSTARNLIHAELETVKQMFNSQLQSLMVTCREKCMLESNRKIEAMADKVRRKRDRINRLRRIQATFEARRLV